jgi:hypothetical protein
MLVAESMGLPFVYVRPEPKNMVDKISGGFFYKNTTRFHEPNSSLQAVEAEAGANVRHGCYSHMGLLFRKKILKMLILISFA